MSHVEFGSDTLHRDDEYTALRFPTTPHPTATNQQRAPFGMNPPVSANLFIQTSDFISADAKENAMESSSGVKRMQEEEAAAANNANPTQSAPAAKKQKKKVVLEFDDGVLEGNGNGGAMEQVDKHADVEYNDTGPVAESRCPDWESTCALLLQEPEDSMYRKNAEMLLKGMEDRDAAQKSLGTVFQSVMATLEDSVKKVLECAVPVHDKVFEKMSTAERDLLYHFGTNHTLRSSIYHALEKHNKEWRRTYNDLMARIGKDVESGSSSPIEGMEVEGSGEPHNGTVVTANDNDQDHEPDWDAIMNFDPSSRDKIHSFLQARERWQATNEQFSHALDEIHAQLKNSNAAVMNSIEDAFYRISDFMEFQQGELQVKMVGNYKHRQQLDKALEEAVQQQQSMFSRLMARVSGNATSNDSKKSGLGGLLAMNPLSYVFPSCPKPPRSES